MQIGNSVSTGTNNVAIGENAASIGENNSLAIGDTVKSTVNDAVSIGSQITNDALNSVVLGSNFLTLDAGSAQTVFFAPNGGTVTKSANSFAFNPYGGTGTSNSSDSVNISGIVTGAPGAVAVGAHSTSSAADALALGHGATASQSNSVALGAGSVAATANTVSVGSTSQQRTITFVKAGDVSATSTDAVNGSQLHDLATKVSASKNKYLAANDAAGSTDGATATGAGSLAVGGNAVADSTGGVEASVAIGSDSRALVERSMAIGPAATASAKGAVAIGTRSVADRADSVSVGSATAQRQIVNVAKGTQDTDVANIAQLKSTGLKLDASGNATNSLVAYDDATLGKITLGGGTVGTTLTKLKAGALSDTSTDAVNGSQLFATNRDVTRTATQLETVASLLGGGAKINGDGSVQAPAYAANGGQQNDVGSAITALDSGLQDRVKYDTPAHDKVTFGIANAPVALTNIKAGALSASSTDAVNGSQLHDTNQNVARTNDELTALSGVAVKYDTTAHDKVTLGNAGTPVALTNVKKAALSASSTDAVNGAQLFETNQGLASLSGDTVKYDSAAHDRVTFGNAGTPVILTNVKAGALKADSTDAVNGSQLFATSEKVAKNTTDIGNLTTTVNTWTNDVATGQVGIVRQDLKTRIISIGGMTDGGTISVAGTAGPRVVTGVANGAVSAASTDALNGSQLFNASSTIAAALGGGAGVDAKGGVSAPTYNVGGTQVHSVGAAIDNLDGRVTKNTTDIASIKGDLANVSEVASNAVAYDSTDHQKVTLGGKDAAVTDGVQLTNVKDGELSAASTDAVNGRQLNATDSKLDEYAGLVSNFQKGGLDYVAVNSSNAPVPIASGTDAVAIGANSRASGNNSVALGAGSVADQDNTVSIGSSGSERRLTNVAPGMNGTDATNVNQMNALRNDLGGSISTLQRNAFSGIAAAMAMPSIAPREAGRTVVAAGIGNYAGYSAVGAGATYRSRDGQWLINGALSVTGHGQTGVRAQMGYEF
ncbi:YadA family autotransporter adhesin [Caballeronia terrestris]|uniref:YadA family autotransporter adhesin n=1 Tax=Caballeronia terrestris TaxID=1226301 RepID=UPI001F24F026|nr:YadA-like family protein [Caballeronia terrestris]